MRAQLAALAGGDLLGASCFSMWHNGGSGGSGGSSRRTSERRCAVQMVEPLCYCTMLKQRVAVALDPPPTHPPPPPLPTHPPPAGLSFHHDALRTQLAQPPYDRLLLLGAAAPAAAAVEARLGAAALPTQREQLQEVELVGLGGGGSEGGGSSGGTRFVWRLGMAAHGCWMVSGIFASEDSWGEGGE